MGKKLDRFFAGLTGILLAATALWVCYQNRPVVVENSGFRPIMGTLAQVTATAENKAIARKAIQAAWEALEKVYQTMNDRDPESELSRLNNSASGQEVVVSSDLFAVLCASQQYSRLTDGAFDITVGPEAALWRRMEKIGKAPAAEEIAEARKKVGYEKMVLNPSRQSVRFEVEGMRLDLGGIAKGYAVDLAIAAMQEQGAKGGMVDVGGNIRCFGTPPPPAKNWIVGIQNPRSESLIGKVRLDNFAVATSGDYRRFAQINEKRYSHILNPATGESIEGLISVTVLAASAMETDALSTAVSVLGKEKGLALIESLPEAEAILIAAEKPEELILSSGAEMYLADY